MFAQFLPFVDFVVWLVLAFWSLDSSVLLLECLAYLQNYSFY